MVRRVHWMVATTTICIVAFGVFEAEKSKVSRNTWIRNSLGHVFGHKPFVNNSTDGVALKAEEVLSVLVHDLLERISGEVAK